MGQTWLACRFNVTLMFTGRLGLIYLICTTGFKLKSAKNLHNRCDVDTVQQACCCPIGGLNSVAVSMDEWQWCNSLKPLSGVNQLHVLCISNRRFSVLEKLTRGNGVNRKPC